MTPDVIRDVKLDDFDDHVLQRSHEVPVVVDFWAAWCGPCRTLGPLLEEAVAGREGQVELAKVDVDANQPLAQRYGVRGIPAVMGFRDGQVVAQFTGAVPRTHIEDFLDRLVPSEADRLVAEARAAEGPAAATYYEQALDHDPNHRAAAVGLADLVVDDDPERALQLVKAHRPDPAAEAVATRAELALSGGGDEDALRQRLDEDPEDEEARLLLGRVLASRGVYEDALTHLLEVVRAGGVHRDTAREQIVGIFTVLGDDHELVRRYRPQLAKALF
ncbi:MAG: thioredoxin [Nitriliruptorales bacterium]|nr:thioredoxin [Nitriliruptorales bacterium]